MNIAKSYITDEAGTIKSVILDYKLYKKIEEVFCNMGFIKAMEQSEDKEDVSYEALLITEEQKAELDRRLNAYQSDKNKGRPAVKSIRFPFKQN